jgi:hypothetical protein
MLRSTGPRDRYDSVSQHLNDPHDLLLESGYYVRYSHPASSDTRVIHR